MYNKIFAKILDSSIWLEDTTTRIIWVTFLAAMDQDGYAHFSAIANLANRARVTMEEAEHAVKILSSPDPDSADPEFEGRRIERIPGGFLILNAEKYRGIVTRIVQREQTKKRVERFREKNKCNASVTHGNDHVTHGNESVTPSDTDTHIDTKTKIKTRGFQPPSVKEVTNYCNERNNKIDPQSFVDHYETNGWIRGKTKIKDWKACIRTWEKNTNGWPAIKEKPSRPLSAVERVRLANGLDDKEVINVN